MASAETVTTTSSTLAAPTATRTLATRPSTTSYAPSTTRSPWMIVVFNTAILLFTTDGEAVRRIHQVCCRRGRLGRCFPGRRSIRGKERPKAIRGSRSLRSEPVRPI